MTARRAEIIAKDDISEAEFWELWNDDCDALKGQMIDGIVYWRYRSIDISILSKASVAVDGH